jgi:prevent-host-death family protein
LARRANFDDMQVNMHDAKSNLSKLVQAVERGEEVVIARDGKPVARLVAYDDPKPKHPFGLLKGRVWEAPDAWDPDPDVEAMLDKWEQEEW